MDPRRLVRTSFDELGPRYLAWAETVRRAERERYTDLLLDSLPTGARVLDLGCGSGGSTTRALAARFHVVGVDISWRTVAAARSAIPGARFVQADMAEVAFAPASFDAIAAFYSMVHVPRQLQPDLLTRMVSWTKRGGLVVVSLGVGNDEASSSENWLGVPMFWSSFDAARGRTMLADAGLERLSADVESATEFGEEVRFLWLVGRRPH